MSTEETIAWLAVGAVLGWIMSDFVAAFFKGMYIGYRKHVGRDFDRAYYSELALIKSENPSHIAYTIKSSLFYFELYILPCLLYVVLPLLTIISIIGTIIACFVA